MWKDPIVEEIRQLREQYASQFNHDFERLFEDIQKRQMQEGKILVCFPPKMPSQMFQNQVPLKLS